MWKCSKCDFAYNEDAADTCKQCHAEKPKHINAGIDYENILRKIAWGILILGVLGSIIMMFSVGYTDTLYGLEVDWMIVRYVIFSLISSIVSWAVLNVIANISCRLKSIDDKMKL